MASKRERELELQQTFVIENDKLVVPEIITELPHGDEVERLVASRSLWQERPKGECLFIDLAVGEDINIINPGTWQVIDQIQPTNDKHNRYSGLLTFTPHLIDISEIMTVVEITEGAIPFLKKSSPVFILEEKGGGLDDLEVRRKALRDVDLVKANIFPGLSQTYLFWESRKEKVLAKRKPVDLTLRENKNYPYLKYLWRKMISDYLGVGFELIKSKDSAIFRRLKASRNHLETISSLRLGFGVTVKKVDCGCTYEIDLKGAETTIWSCKENHDGSPRLFFEKPKEKEPQKEEYILGEHKIKEVCFGCGNGLVRTVIELKRRGEVIKIGIQDACSSHGIIEYKEEEILTSQITFPS